MMLKIVHCADIHIGASFGRLPSHLASLRAEEQRNTFLNTIIYCKEKSVDALLICGDLFDSPTPSKRDAEFVRKALSSLSPVPVFIITGNHDYMCSDSPFSKGNYFSDNVHIFPCFDYHFDIPEKNTVIYGKSYSSAFTEASFTDISPDKSRINILCLHGDFNSSGDYNQINKDLLSSLPINYTAMGHIHKEEIFQSGNVKCAYSGALDPTGFDDDGFTGFIYAEITEDETNLSPIPLSKRHYRNISYDVSGEDTEKILQGIKNIINSEDLYKITLVGETSDELNTDFLQNELEPCCFYVELFDETSISYDFDAIEKEESLRGEFLREVRKLTVSEEEFILCGKAGLDALTGKIPSMEVDV
ncbi:MAG: DNA repair exonuclease [Ruminococcaceae bacterium]|nr:DNA repair exonuclease [Oscillospiraceae bacterium]